MEVKRDWAFDTPKVRKERRVWKVLVV